MDRWHEADNRLLFHVSDRVLKAVVDSQALKHIFAFEPDLVTCFNDVIFRGVDTMETQISICLLCAGNNSLNEVCAACGLWFITHRSVQNTSCCVSCNV